MTTPSTRPRWTLPWGPPITASGACSDDELLLLVARGDHRAFAHLYDHLAGVVYANVRRVLGDRTRTDDVAEEAFIEVWRRAARFDPLRVNAADWVLDLAHQLAVERARRDLVVPR